MQGEKNVDRIQILLPPTNMQGQNGRSLASLSSSGETSETSYPGQPWRDSCKKGHLIWPGSKWSVPSRAMEVLWLAHILVTLWLEGTEPKIKWLLPVASVNNHWENVDCLIARWNINRETGEAMELESGKLRALGSHAIVLGICFLAHSCHTLNTWLTCPPLLFLYQMGALTFVSWAPQETMGSCLSLHHRDGRISRVTWLGLLSLPRTPPLKWGGNVCATKPLVE